MTRDNELPSTGQTRCYDGAGQEINGANAEWPGQDGFYRKGYPAEDRFVDNGDGTVTDRCTGLVWQKKTAPGEYTWKDALKYCEGLDLAGYTDWRLPNVQELSSIVDYGRFDPAIAAVFGAVSSWYWSSSTNVGYPGQAWGVNFSGGYVYYFHESNDGYVRAVRG